MKSRKSWAIALGAVLCVTSAKAVEPFADAIELWYTDADRDIFFAGFDVYPNTPGIEIIGGTEGLDVVAASNPANLQTVSKLRVLVRDSGTNTKIQGFVANVKSAGWPDPAVGGVSYVCTYGEDFEFVDPTVDDFPCSFSVGAGVANWGSARRVVIALGVFAGYIQAGGYTDISRVAIDVFNPGNGNKVWERQFKVVDGNWELSTALSGVSDYLDGDGNDELRVVYERELSRGRIRYRYIYYQMNDGSPIKTDEFVVPGV